MNFSMPLEYVAALLLFTNVCTVAVIVLALYAKGYLGRRPAQATRLDRAATAQTLGQDRPKPPDALGVEGVVQARIEAESQVSKTLARLKMQTQMLESGLEATKAG